MLMKVALALVGPVENMTVNDGRIYDPELIAGLKDSQRELVRLHCELQVAAALDDYPNIGRLLVMLRDSTIEHFERESYMLMGYLARQRKRRNLSSTGIFDFRREMESVGRASTEFAERYLKTGVSDDNCHIFRKELDVRGIRLVERLERAETELYIQYQP